jgi:DNA-binding CsgD family transcriptional regulator
VETVLAAAADRPYVGPTLAGMIVGDSRPERPTLSDKEREALLLWFQSMSKASVARRMRISEHTVKQYVDRARIKYAKVGRPAASKAALLARAIEDGLVRPDEIREYRSNASRHFT